MEHLQNSPVIAEIERELSAVTDTQLKRAEHKLTKLSDKDKSLGIITNPLTKRLWVVANRFHVRAAELIVKSKAVESDEEEERLEREARRADKLEDICREIAWLEIRDELQLDQEISIREAWMVVEPAPKQVELSGGIIRLPQGLQGLSGLQGLFGQAEAEEE
jgi:hypothetical protein